MLKVGQSQAGDLDVLIRLKVGCCRGVPVLMFARASRGELVRIEPSLSSVFVHVAFW